ncbi:MAG: LysR family transcriptional regulator [Blastomonas sp. CACIA14H2]|uniref:RidA family protein n=1 Tax=Blastomonas sp. CACIA14H2 TaxID=1419876 RepID=UPI0003D05DCA|nr:MAG: LysR family transcriptional regulator [Blastomonas sp. CACIA14H2]
MKLDDSAPDGRFQKILGRPVAGRKLAKPSGLYQLVVRHGAMAYVSGHAPKIDGTLAVAGKVGDDIDFPKAQEAARLCVVQCLLSLRREIGSLDHVERVIKLVGFVNVAPGFLRLPAVVDGASALLHEVFGNVIGQHARSSMGVAELPDGAAVVIELVLALRDDLNGAAISP